MLRKWGRWVVMGSKIDSGGTCTSITMLTEATLLLSFLYHFFRRVTSFPIVSSTAVSCTRVSLRGSSTFINSSVSISDGMGL